MNFWQAARREASGALRSVRYDFVETLVGNRGTRRVLALTGLTAMVAAGGVGTAFAVANNGTVANTPAAHDRPAVVVTSPSDPSVLDSPTTAPSPKKTPKPSKSATEGPVDDWSSPSASPSKAPTKGHPVPTPVQTTPVTPPPTPTPTPTPTSPSPSPSPSSPSATSTVSMSPTSTATYTPSSSASATQV